MSTHYQGTAREKLILDTWIKMSRAKVTLDRVMRLNIEKQGITMSQFAVLETLLHLGPLSVKDISQKILLTTSNLVTVIDNLVKRNLVKRVPCSHDRRSVIIHLTQTGEDKVAPIFQNHLTELIDRFAVLSETQLDQLGSLSKDLGLYQTKKEYIL